MTKGTVRMGIKRKLEEEIEETKYENMVVTSDNEEDNYPCAVIFNPNEEELLEYLRLKILNKPLPCSLIKNLNYYDHPPWKLKRLCAMKKVVVSYFFTLRDKKYAHGKRPNRVIKSGEGFWKAIGADQIITTKEGEKLEGVHKALKFYVGKKPGMKTDWIIHEYRVTNPNLKPDLSTSENPMRLDWVLCKLYKIERDNKKTEGDEGVEEEEEEEGAILVAHDMMKEGTLAAKTEVEEGALVVEADNSLTIVTENEAHLSYNVTETINGDFNYDPCHGSNELVEGLFGDIPPYDFDDLNCNYDTTMLSQSESLPSTMIAQVLGSTPELISASFPSTSSDFYDPMGFLHGVLMPQLPATSYMHEQTEVLQNATTSYLPYAYLEQISAQPLKTTSNETTDCLAPNKYIRTMGIENFEENGSHIKDS